MIRVGVVPAIMVPPASASGDAAEAVVPTSVSPLAALAASAARTVPLQLLLLNGAAVDGGAALQLPVESRFRPIYAPGRSFFKEALDGRGDEGEGFDFEDDDDCSGDDGDYSDSESDDDDYESDYASDERIYDSEEYRSISSSNSNNPNDSVSSEMSGEASGFSAGERLPDAASGLRYPVKIIRGRWLVIDYVDGDDVEQANISSAAAATAATADSAAVAGFSPLLAGIGQMSLVGGDPQTSQPLSLQQQQQQQKHHNADGRLKPSEIFQDVVMQEEEETPRVELPLRNENEDDEASDEFEMELARYLKGVDVPGGQQLNVFR